MSELGYNTIVVKNLVYEIHYEDEVVRIGYNDGIVFIEGEYEFSEITLSSLSDALSGINPEDAIEFIEEIQSKI